MCIMGEAISTTIAFSFWQFPKLYIILWYLFGITESNNVVILIGPHLLANNYFLLFLCSWLCDDLMSQVPSSASKEFDVFSSNC